MNQITFKNRIEFREWLTENALSDKGYWLVISKQKPSNTITAKEALEEALCFGWIDSQMKSIDENTYIKYFKKRRKNSNWSQRNKKIIEELELKNLMNDFGRAKIEEAKQNGHWNDQKPNSLTEQQIIQFENMIKPYEKAYINFIDMSPSARKTYAKSYYFGAKTDKGKQKRFDTIIERLNLNLNPMESMKKKT